MISEKIINEEIEYIRTALYSNLEQYINKTKLFFQNDKNLPNRIFCIRKEKGWYYYQCDEKFIGYYSGPYDKNALIQMIAILLPISKDILKKIEQEYYSKEMAEGKYLDNKIFKGYRQS